MIFITVKKQMKMSSLLVELSNVINENLKIPIVSKEINIEEDDEQTTCKNLKFICNNNKYFAFTLDRCIPRNAHRFPFFNQSQDVINKANDSIIVHDNNGEIYILLVELKSDNLGTYLKQLKCGKSFIEYIFNIINIKYSKNYVINDDNVRCVVATTRRTVRKPSFKRQNVSFEIRNNMKVTEQQCNEVHHICKFFN